jgi:hypothetical protein
MTTCQLPHQIDERVRWHFSILGFLMATIAVIALATVEFCVSS